MTQNERRIYLIKSLLEELPPHQRRPIPDEPAGQEQLLRALFNVRMPGPASPEFLQIQDAYLQAETAKKGITTLKMLTPVQKELFLWRGDITTLKSDAIVNAANSQMLGCFCPNHGCIDNAIHTFAGIQLRNACAALIEEQGHEEPAGSAKITPAFNLPCRFILHTVGPVVYGSLTDEDCRLLASCYTSCLTLADQNNIQSIAFCCISTGEFHFPNEAAARIAIETVKAYKARTQSRIQVIFNVFKEEDHDIYQRLLRTDQED